MLKAFFDKANAIYEYRFPRPMIEYLKEREGKDLIGVEIGTQSGINALNMLKNLSIKTLYLVDPYKFYEYRGRTEGAVDSDIVQEKHFQRAMDNLLRYKGYIKFIYLKSEDASRHIPKGLDFVYIDGNHDYQFVKKDLFLYWRKVRKGGVMGGHDINHPGVFRAVAEFRNRRNKKIHIERKDWWFIK